MIEEELQFVSLLTKAELTAGQFDEKENAREAALDTLDSELDEMVEVDGIRMPLRESLHQAMDVKLVDSKGKEQKGFFSEKGQEYEADSHEASQKGYTMREEDQPKVQRAMEQVMALIEKLKAKKGPDGQPLYTDQELMDEVYTPLMRERLLPDNLIIDKYSATSDMLKNTFGSYKASLAKAEEEKRDKLNSNEADYQGASGKLGQLKSLGGKASEIGERLQGKLMQKLGVSEDQMRRLTLIKGVGSELASSIKKNASGLEDLIPDALSSEVGDILNPILGKINQEEARLMGSAKEHLDPLLNKAQEHLGGFGQALSREGHLMEGALGTGGGDGSPSASEVKQTMAQQVSARAMEIFSHFAEEVKKQVSDEGAQAQWLQAAGDKISELAEAMQKGIKEIPGEEELEAYIREHVDEFTKSCKDALPTVGKAVGGAISDSLALDDLDAALEKSDQAGRIVAAVRNAVKKMDQALTKVISEIEPTVGAMISGQFSSRVSVKDAIELAQATPVDGKKVVELFAAAVQQAIADAAPDVADEDEDEPPAPKSPPKDESYKLAGPIFQKAGAAVAKTFRAQAPANGLAEALKNDPATAFNGLISALEGAAKKELTGGGTGTEPPSDPGNVNAFAGQLKNRVTQQKILAKSAFPNEEETLEELERSEEEMREQESSLMLLEEGGLSMETAKSIDGMIRDLKRERKILQLVASLGGTLLGAGVKAVQPFAEQVPGTIVLDVLKIARMVLTLAVNTKKAADRWILWLKFRKSLEHSRAAVSNMTSSIQGFYNNKKEQITFHTIDDALQAVQIAAAIVGTVPEPITMAVGKSVGAAAALGQTLNQVSNQIYNEVMLTKAWKTTVEAMNNPGNRVLGLAALRLNATLAMHAVAWASVERRPPDPIARMLMGKLGITEQMLDAGNAEQTSGKVREYLSTLLDEDRQIMRSEGIRLNWLPKNYTLSARDFFVITSRAARDATPKLALAGEKAVIDALKPLDQHDLGKLNGRAKAGELTPEEMESLQAEVERAAEALKKYQPKTADRSEHEDMANVKADLLAKCASHRKTILDIIERNRVADDRKQAAIELRDAITALQDVALDSDETTMQDALDEARKTQLAIGERPKVLGDPEVRTLLKDLDNEIDQMQMRVYAAQVA